MKNSTKGLMLLGALALGATMDPRSASACGGFFCSQAQGVNQTAERIVFANNGDGTVTAVIEIKYEGPADKFSWLLPISSVPQAGDIAVASSSSFTRLQNATNPRYTLTTRVEGTCDPELNVGVGGTASSFPTGTASGGASNAGPGGVSVVASGVVGAFEWKAIELDPALAAPADAAVAWLKENGYDVPEGAPGLLGPYLADGMYLLALRLQKGATTGSIRPIVLTYEAEKPMIPIKLTAVAANDDMGVMTWVLGDHQAIPVNYYALELNEARINWFNPNSNYNDLVTAAADEASGQGFVTEYAQPTAALGRVVWAESDEANWQAALSSESTSTPTQAVETTLRSYASFDGFWDVFREHVTLPAGMTVEDVQNCPFCAHDGVAAGVGYLAALEKDVIAPARVVQQLLDSHPYLTRLYSTLSAAEMTVDPLFSYNPDLQPVSNLHNAVRVIECAPGYYTRTAPWRIELPQGGVVRGLAADVGLWPGSFAKQPANRRILRQAESGPGRILEDNGAAIDQDITTYSNSGTVMMGGSGGSDANGGSSASGGSNASNPSAAGAADEAVGGANPADTGTPQTAGAGLSGDPGCGCSFASQRPYAGAFLALLSLAALRRRRVARA